MSTKQNSILVENNSSYFIKFTISDFNSQNTPLQSSDAIPSSFGKKLFISDMPSKIVIRTYYLENGVSWVEMAKATFSNVKELVVSANNPNIPLTVRKHN
ncbi:MAG: hypothetical protein RR840_01035 [Clostridium sp.]